MTKQEIYKTIRDNPHVSLHKELFTTNIFGELVQRKGRFLEVEDGMVRIISTGEEDEYEDSLTTYGKTLSDIQAKTSSPAAAQKNPSGKRGDSIFKFEQEAGIDSVLGNWIEKRQIKEDERKQNLSISVMDIFIAKEVKTSQGISYQRISQARLGDEICIVAWCIGQTGVLKIQLMENLIGGITSVLGSPVRFMADGVEKTEIEFKISGAQKQYAQKIKLCPKDDSKNREISDGLKNAKDSKTYIYLRAEISGSQDLLIIWSLNNSNYSSFGKTNNVAEFLKEEYEKFEVKYCYCSEYYFENNFIKGPNVTLTKSGNKVIGKGNIKNIIAIILHRTAGSDTAGAISHTIGAHFYVDRGTNDGEIFQPVGLDKSTSHIMNETARISHFEIQTENSIGIEVVGMAYYYEDNKLYNVYGKNVSQDKVSLSEGYSKKDKNGIIKTYYWDKLTDKQIFSVSCLVKKLMEKYSLSVNNIFTHEEIQSKTPGEGEVVKKAILEYL